MRRPWNSDPVGSSTLRLTLTAASPRRENQVLDVVAEGASNGEIAQRLSISPGTVKKHLENIFGKLDVASRTAALARTGRTVGPTQRDVHGST